MRAISVVVVWFVFRFRFRLLAAAPATAQKIDLLKHALTHNVNEVTLASLYATLKRLLFISSVFSFVQLSKLVDAMLKTVPTPRR